MAEVTFEVVGRPPSRRRKPRETLGLYHRLAWHLAVKKAFAAVRNGYEDVAVREITITHVMEVDESDAD